MARARPGAGIRGPPYGRGVMAMPVTGAGFERFAIGFDRGDRPRLHALWDEILDSQQWTDGAMTRRFDALWAAQHGAGCVATSGWTGAALAALDYAGVGRGDVVLCPSNTFMATPLAAVRLGARVEFVDCERDDLCVSLTDLERKIAEHQPKAVIVVHIGGHVAFRIEAIAALCRAQGVFLLEDCAHAHGAHWHGRRPGTWGDAGAYSFYATKTISTGEGGMLVSRDEDLLEHAPALSNYGKPYPEVAGLTFRSTEFTAVIGLVQPERLDEIVAAKNRFARRE